MRSISLFEQWMTAVKIEWNSEALKLADESRNNMAVRATKDLHLSQTLCVIPKAALLSVRNSSLAAALNDARIGGGLALAVALLHEMLKGPDSHWCDLRYTGSCCCARAMRCVRSLHWPFVVGSSCHSCCLQQLFHCAIKHTSSSVQAWLHPVLATARILANLLVGRVEESCS